MLAVLALLCLDLPIDTINVPGWTYLTLFVIAFIWNMIQVIAENR